MYVCVAVLTVICEITNSTTGVASADGRDVIFRVADTGVGVDPKDLPYIFDRFRQGDGSTTRAYRGTGIGLALAKAYVELHGGKIEVESGPGQGATFTIRIPDAARGASQDGLARPSSSPPVSPP